MEEKFVFINDDDQESIFYRKMYYDFICETITSFFNKELVMNDYHKHFIKMLNSLEDYDDVYNITSETPDYWALSIMENDVTNKSLSSEEDGKFIEFYKKTLLNNNISSFIENSMFRI